MKLAHCLNTFLMSFHSLTGNLSVPSAGPYLEKNYWGANTDRVAQGHGKGDGVGGGCAPSCAEREAKTTSISQRNYIKANLSGLANRIVMSHMRVQ